MDARFDKYIRNLLKSDFAKFLKYEQHLNENIVLLSNNYLLQTILVEGFPFQTADDGTLEDRKRLLNNIYKSISIPEVTLYVNIIRSKTKLEIANVKNIDYSNFVRSLQQEWNNNYAGIDSFENYIFLSIVYDAKGITDTNKENYIKNLNNISFNLMASMNYYNPKLLTTYEKDGNLYSEIVNFLYMLANSGLKKEIMLNGSNIANLITNTKVEFGTDFIEISQNHIKKFIKIITNSRYAKYTAAGIFDGFLTTPSECIITHVFKYIHRNDALTTIQNQQNRLISSEDKAFSQVGELTVALDALSSNDINFGYHSMSVEVIASNENELNLAVSHVINKMVITGFITNIETTNAEALFWAKFPGNMHLCARSCMISTLNFAGMASMHMYPTGKKNNNFWGEYLTIFSTSSNTLYYFNFHVKDVGHSVIIGPTGAGKTVLLNFLCVQAEKFKPKLFFFDKDHGAEIFIRAIKGKYKVINPNVECNFNPLQLDDTSENREFLIEWLRSLAEVLNHQISSKDINILNQAVEGVFKLMKKDRNLSNLLSFLETETDTNITSKIKLWSKTGAYGKLFDNTIDEINFNNNRVFGFEMQYLLNNKTILPPVLLYLFHRINLALDGSPTILVLDEAWALISNKIFAQKIKDWLKVLRKKNAIVVFATQSVEDAVHSEISETIIQQTATQIFFPNPKATQEYKNAFLLSNREFDLILNTSIQSRFFLIKQEKNAVVAKLDLGYLQKFLYVLSGTTKNVNILQKIISEKGENGWLEEFYNLASK